MIKNIKDISLDELIICKKCDTLHHKKKLKVGAVAKCRECGSILYRHHRNLIDYGLAIGLSALIFFIIANSFEIVNIELRGVRQGITLPSVLLSLFENGFLVVGIFCSFVIFIFPFMLLVVYIWMMYLMKLKVGEKKVEKLLIFLAKLLPWNMSEIFLISIFVALVKLIGYADIHFGLSLWALMVFVGFDLYLSKSISIDELWRAKRRIYRGKDV
jgi:paraquat-inducible protein A